MRFSHSPMEWKFENGEVAEWFNALVLKTSDIPLVIDI